MVKNLPAMQEMQFQSLGWEDPQKKEMATHSSTLAWEIPGAEEAGGPQSMGSQRVRHDLTAKSTHLICTLPNNCVNPWSHQVLSILRENATPVSLGSPDPPQVNGC